MLPPTSVTASGAGPPSAGPLLDDFDRRWRTGPAPRIEDFLAAVPAGPGRRALLLELVPIDLEYRWRAYQAKRTQNATVNADQRPAAARAPDTPPLAAPAGGLPEHPLLEHYVRQFPDLGGLDELPLDLVGAEYFARRLWGDSPSPREYLARFASRAELVQEALRRAEAELARESARRPPQPKTDPDFSTPAAVVVCCPHCKGTLAVTGAAGDRPVTCPACGKAFRLDVTPPAEGPPFQRIGRYQLGARLGAGAFGTVWKGWDTELQRAVAVKVPRGGRFFGAEEEERFLREARAAAGLHHEGIVAVYDAGREEQSLYIVCELVHGQSLSERLAQGRLDFREAAELVARVADALDYAHRRGVVHRDLKPSNILLEANREQGTGDREPPGSTLFPVPCPLFPRIADFGLAKRSGSEVTMTLDGHLLGTPAYMSPEQIRDPHAADGRSDVYSLGVVLYQLLTGVLPFHGEAAVLLQQVQTDEPRPPRRVNGRIPADLETICLKCLAKEPSHRYATAAALAEDLRHWLAGEAIKARPVGPLGRLSRWAKRKPALAGLAAAVLLLLLAVTFVSTGAALVIARQKDDAVAARRQAEANARAAEAAEKEAKAQRADAEKARHQADLERDLALNALNTFVGVADGQLAGIAGTQKIRQSILNTAIAELQRITRQSEKTGARQSMLSAHLALGKVLYSLGRTQEALQEYERGCALGEELVKAPKRPGPGWNEVAALYIRAGEIRHEFGDLAGARKSCRRAQELEEAWLRDDPRNFEARRILYWATRKLADVVADTGDGAAARRLAEQARDLAEELARANAAAAKYERASAYARLAKLTEDDLQQALELYGKSHALFQELQEASPLDYRPYAELAQSHGSLGEANQRLHRFKEAAEHYEAALDWWQKLARVESNNALVWRGLAVAHLQAAGLKLHRGDPDGARAAGQEALKVLRHLAGFDTQNVQVKRYLATAYEQLGDLYMYLGAAEARAYLEQAVAIREKLLEADPNNRQRQAELVRPCNLMALSYNRQRQYAEALKWQERCLELLRKLGASAQGAEVAVNAGARQRVESHIAACKGFARAVEDLQFALDQPDAVAAQLLAMRATALARRGKVADAAATVEKLNERFPNNPDQQFSVACCYALCAAPDGKDDPNAPAAVKAARQKYQDLALKALARSVELGFKNLAEIVNDPDLACLRARPEYAELVKRLREGR